MLLNVAMPVLATELIEVSDLNSLRREALGNALKRQTAWYPGALLPCAQMLD